MFAGQRGAGPDRPETRDKDAAAANGSGNRCPRPRAEVSSHLLADVSVRRSYPRLVAATAAEQLGRVDVLCANAGIFPDIKRLADMTDEDLDTVLGTNLRGCILSVQACLHPRCSSRARPGHP